MRLQPLLLQDYAAIARARDDLALRDPHAPRLFSVEVPDTPFSTLMLVSPVGKLYRIVPSMGRAYRAWLNKEEHDRAAPGMMNRKLRSSGLSLADLGGDLLGVSYFHGPREFTVWPTACRVRYFCLTGQLPMLADALAESMPMIEEWQAEEVDAATERERDLHESTFGVLFGPLSLFGMVGYGISSEQMWRDVISRLPPAAYDEGKQQLEGGLASAAARLERAVAEVKGLAGSVAKEKWRRAATLGTPIISWPSFGRVCSPELVYEVIQLRTRLIELLDTPRFHAVLAEREFMDLEEKPNQLDQLKWIASDSPPGFRDRVLDCAKRLEVVVERICARYPALGRDVLAGGIDASIKQFRAA